jgi:hypothetical protein
MRIGNEKPAFPKATTTKHPAIDVGESRYESRF